MAESILIQNNDDSESASQIKMQQKQLGHFEFKQDTTGMLSGITETGYQEKPSEEYPQTEVEIGEVSYLHPISDNDFEGPSSQF